jgi:predicted RNA-binding Zn ribbon-like protein
MVASEKDEGSLNLKSGRLCLDFANTADWHASDQPEEKLNSYADLVSWSEQVGILTKAEARQLLRKAADHPDDAAMVLEQAISFREAIYRIFSAIAMGASAETADLAILNEALSTALGQLYIVSTSAGFGWEWTAEEADLERILWPVAQSAADLLTSAELRRVGQCADERCGWLFMDMSRNRSRRWCDMRDCGNRAKARRHYERKRAANT